MSAHRLRSRWELMGRSPVAMQATAQAHAELRGRQRTGCQALRIEYEEVRQAFRQPVDNSDQVAFALAGAARLGHETRLLDGRGGAGPPGLRLTGLMIEPGETIDHHAGGRFSVRQLQGA